MNFKIDNDDVVLTVGDQEILKVKGDDYHARHGMKSELASIDRVIDFWFISGKLPYQQFFDHCVEAVDYESAMDARGFISNICDAWKEVEQIVAGFKVFVEKVKGLSRKDAAAMILQAYGNTNRASFIFNLLDGGTLDDDKLKKILYQALKK